VRWHVVSELSDSLERHHPELLSLGVDAGETPLDDWPAARPRAVDICDILPPHLSGHRRAQLEERLRSSSIARLILAQPPPPVLAYSGRWTDVDPPCRRLNRIEVDDRGTLRVCRHGAPIGSVGDPLAVIVGTFEGLRRAAVARRAGLCGAPGSVPGCPFPNVDDRSYCAAFDEQRRLWRALDLLARVPGLFVEVDSD